MPDVNPPTKIGSLLPCPNCKKGAIKEVTFRTGSVDHPEKKVYTCKKCGYRSDK